jgi:replicative DNA helicase
MKVDSGHPDPPGVGRVSGGTEIPGTESGSPESDLTTSLEQRVTRADNGVETPFGKLTYADAPPLLWSLDERMRLVKHRVAGSVARGEREAFWLTLASGRQLLLIDQQEMLKVNGWSSVSQVMPGSRIATVRRLPEPVYPQRMHDSEVILLAHMIGDGSCVRRQPIRYASIDEENLIAVETAAAHFGVTPIRDDYPAARVTTLRLPAPFRLTHGKRNPIAEWLDTLGLFGLRSYEKFVPAEVFTLPNDQVALFLRHLWATDGSVRWDGKTSQGRVYYASTSRRLIDDVMQLLLRMRVQGRIVRTTKQGYRPCWHLTIDRGENQIAFLTRVGVHGARGIKAEEVVANLAGRTRRPGTDTIPVEIWNRVKQGFLDRSWTDVDFATATNTRFDGARMWTHAPGRRRLHRISVIMSDPFLHDLATNDIYWDKVVGVKRLGRRQIDCLSEVGRRPIIVSGVVVR